MKDKRAYQKLLKARTSLVINHPFFASLALRLKVKEDYTCATAWTDGQLFGYNPNYIRILSPEKLEGLTAHTVMHPACGHHKRRGKRDHDLWNRACDYAVNAILLESGFTLPDGFLFDETYAGRSAEAVYTILQGVVDDAESMDEDDDPQAEGSNSSPGDKTAESEPSSSEDEKRGDDDEKELSSGDPGKSGEVRDTPSDGGGSDSGHETDWDESLIQAFVNALGMGKLPAGVERFIQRKINPKLGWKELLARFVEQSARSDYSWVTPNRRYIHQGLYLPSLQNHELSNMVIAVDTSGSITPEELAQFSAEISEILENFPATLHLVYCDAKVSGYQVFDRSDLPLTLQPVGGGGTDFRPTFDFVEKNGLMPSCLIYLTDLECLHFPEPHPPYPVLWVKSGTGNRKPPFGDVIDL